MIQDMGKSFRGTRASRSATNWLDQHLPVMRDLVRGVGGWFNVYCGWFNVY